MNCIAGYADRIANGSFKITSESPGFPATGGLKDLGLILELGDQSGVVTPVAKITHAHLRQLSEQEGGAQMDWGAVACIIRQAAGMSRAAD